MGRIRETVEELTELADALLFQGETEAYELSRRDWIHRLKLEKYFPSSDHTKRPFESSSIVPSKKQRHNYFEDASESVTSIQQVVVKQDHVSGQVLWEYKGNEDGTIHGPYTSQQMMEWTACGYFVGESAVDIRKVGSLETKKEAAA